MNPKQLRVMLQPESGHWFLVRAQPAKVTVLRDVTQDIALCLLGDIKNAEPGATGIQYEIEANAPNGDRARIQITAEILELVEGKAGEGGA